MSQQICPWCQMEIVWDPDTGPEEICPHCLNELKDYRTLTLDIEEADTDLYEYETQVESYLEKQDPEQTLECEQCQQKMIEAGVINMKNEDFIPKTVSGMSPFLKAPFEMVVHVCPACFQMKTTLSETSRLEVIRALQQ